MKILIVNTHEVEGGAARAANRLHKSLLEYGLNSTMIVQSKSTNDPSVVSIYDKNESNNINKCHKEILKKYPNKSKTLFSNSNIDSIKLVELINSLSPDIVHLHWVASGFLRIEDIPKIHSHIIWNCHDMMAFTGGCHYDERCDRYKVNCGYCKVLNSEKEYDLSNENFNRKLNAYKNVHSLTFVGTSKWMTKSLNSSPLSNHTNIVNIPSGADKHIFQPIDKKLCRDIFKIPNDKKVILFGAMDPLGDPRKGAIELLSALKILSLDNIALVIAGTFSLNEKLGLDFPIYYVPTIHDEASLSMMYNVADVVIVPSLQENLANTIVESLLCGVPVVAFNIGGNPDMITHKTNGYLVEPFNTDDMVQGIEWILNNKKYDELSLNARKNASLLFDTTIQVKKYYELYNKILEDGYNKNFVKSLDDDINQVTPCNVMEYYDSSQFYSVLQEIKDKNLQCVIYGAGTVSKTITAVISDNILCYVDVQSTNYYTGSINNQIYHPCNLSKMKYDNIIISVLGREKEITNYLLNELHISQNKIITFDLKEK